VYHPSSKNTAHCKLAMICYNQRTMIDPTPIDITNIPELVRIAEEVETTNKPRLLKSDNTPIALLTPLKKKQPRQATSKAIKETLALAGAWGERDWEEVEAELDRIRHESTPTPAFKL
jgi:hypothetical protein